jgi:hypothetical protein
MCTKKYHVELMSKVHSLQRKEMWEETSIAKDVMRFKIAPF